MLFLIDSILYSYSQIFFSNKRYSGVFILLATFLNPLIGLGAFFGGLLCNLTAILLKYDKAKIKSGFYGFNGILIGGAVLYYFKFSPLILIYFIIFILISFFISAAIEHFFANLFNLPGLSVPFVITLYILIIFSSNFSNIEKLYYLHSSGQSFFQIPYFVEQYLQSLGLVLFQSNILAGFILTISIVVFSRVQFVVSILTYSITFFIFNYFFVEQTQTLFQIAAFNSILTGMAIGGALVIPSKRSIPLIFFSTLMVIVITIFFYKLLLYTNLPIVVLPFNFIVLSTIYSLKFRQEQSELVLLYFSPGSPEENYFYHNNRKERFDKMTQLLPELPVMGEWYISQGNNGSHTHKQDWKEAIDFVINDNESKEFQNTGNNLKDYYCFQLPVIAPLDGEVVNIQDNIPNNEIGKNNLKYNFGNSIVLKHSQNIYSCLSHLDPSSIKVKINDKVIQGDLIASCGNSGRSPSPHLHFQFQKTEKIGDKTIDFPFSHFLTNQDGSLVLKTFTVPEEGTKVQNIEKHKIIFSAFNFNLGDSFEFDCVLENKPFSEKWEIKADILNNMYIESDRNSYMYFFHNGKIFYSSDFLGEKKSALYYFYLSTLMTPMCFYENLLWKENLSLTKVVDNLTLYVSEFFLLFKQLIIAEAHYTFFTEDNPDYFCINSDINISGRGLMKFYNENLNGFLFINYNSKFEKIIFTKNSENIFLANLKIQKEKINEEILID